MKFTSTILIAFATSSADAAHSLLPAPAVQAEMKDASATATEKQEKAKQIVQRMITKYMQEPAHKQQFEQIKGEIMDFFSAHKADISKWVTAHKTQIVAWLKAKIAEVESGNLKDESCDLTDPKCMKEMGITQPEVQKYLVEHKVEVQKKMEAYKAKYAEFITKHKGEIVAFLQAVTKVVETGDMSAVKTYVKTYYKKPMLGTDPNTYTPKSLPQSEAPAAAVGTCTSMHGNGDTCAKITSEADCGASNGSCIWKATAATGAAPATSRYLETATPADLQVALGTYKGDAKKGIGCVFGYCATTIKVNTIATAKAGNKMDVVVKGSGIATVNMDCKDEPYTLDAAGKITLLNYPHTDKSTSKCIVDALPLGVSLKSLTYDAAKHEVDISVGPIDLVVTAKCNDCAAAPAVGTDPSTYTPKSLTESDAPAAAPTSSAAAPAAAAPASRKLRGGRY